MISDAIGVQEVLKPILFLKLLCGADQLLQMLLAKQCLSLYLLTDNKILSKILTIGFIMIHKFKNSYLTMDQFKEALK